MRNFLIAAIILSHILTLTLTCTNSLYLFTSTVPIH